MQEGSGGMPLGDRCIMIPSKAIFSANVSLNLVMQEVPTARISNMCVDINHTHWPCQNLPAMLLVDIHAYVC